MKKCSLKQNKGRKVCIAENVHQSIESGEQLEAIQMSLSELQSYINEVNKALVEFQKINRQLFAKVYKEKIKDTAIEQQLSQIVDGGIKKSKDFYLGAEQMAFRSYQAFDNIGSSEHQHTWLLVIGYISWRLIGLTDENTSDTDRNQEVPRYIS